MFSVNFSLSILQTYGFLNSYIVKANKAFKIPLLQKAKAIMEQCENESEHVFTSMSNAKFNAYLKKIADTASIDTRLTHHIARTTFTTTVLLYNDVSMEILSKLLDHSKIHTR